MRWMEQWTRFEDICMARLLPVVATSFGTDEMSIRLTVNEELLEVTPLALTIYCSVITLYMHLLPS